jgi:hypothetical protein
MTGHYTYSESSAIDFNGPADDFLAQAAGHPSDTVSRAV